MAVSTVVSNSVQLQLNNGTASGVIQTVNVSLPKLANSGFDGEKVLNIADAFENICTKEIYRVRHTQVSTLSRV